MSFRTLLASFTALLLTGSVAFSAETVLKPKVVVVTMFEIGEDKGDTPGELQLWVEREKLDRVIPLPAGYHDVRTNEDGSVIAIVTGMGNVNAASSLMALGLDPRFDLSQSYWLVAGIAGIDPADGSIGSAVWTDYAVDGDLAHEIDAREAPADWPTGYVPLRKTKPYELPRNPKDTVPGAGYRLNDSLVKWAYALTKDTELIDNEQMHKRNATYTGFPNAQKKPFVLIGANLAASTYWHGKLLNQWANEWVRYQTDGAANYVSTAMEDTGTLRALENLTKAGRADINRAMVLRTASNYDMQWPGGNAAESMSGEHVGVYSAYIPSLEAAHRVGSKVVHAIVANWAHFSANTTAPAASQ